MWLSISVLLHKLLKLFNAIQFADMAEKYVYLTHKFFLKNTDRSTAVSFFNKISVDMCMKDVYCGSQKKFNRLLSILRIFSLLKTFILNLMQIRLIGHSSVT